MFVFVLGACACLVFVFVAPLPTEIPQALLNLAEFMEHHGKP